MKWKHERHSAVDVICDEKGTIVCTINPYSTRKQSEDINLLAAAPELLNILQEVIDNWHVLDREDYVNVSRAIEKATGD